MTVVRMKKTVGSGLLPLNLRPIIGGKMLLFRKQTAPANGIEAGLFAYPMPSCQYSNGENRRSGQGCDDVSVDFLFRP